MKKKINNKEFICVIIVMLFITLMFLVSKLLKMTYLIPLGLVCLSLVLSYTINSNLSKFYFKKKEYDNEIVTYFLLNGFESFSSIKFKDKKMNIATNDFLKSINDNNLIVPYLKYLNNFEDAKVKEILINLYEINKVKKINNTCLNKNLILLHSYNYVKNKEANEIIYISYVLVLIVSFIFLLKVFLK